MVDKNTGEILGSLEWLNGYQVYDVQFLPGMARPGFPVVQWLGRH